MTQMIGRIDALNTKEVKTKWGMKSVYEIQVGGMVYKTNFKKPAFNVGDVVQFEFNSGKYGNEVVDGTMQASKASVPQSLTAQPQGVQLVQAPAARSYQERTFPVGALSPERAIIRQNALTNARELFTSILSMDEKGSFLGKTEVNDFAGKIISLARKFEAYSAGDLDVEEVKAEEAAK